VFLGTVAAFSIEHIWVLQRNPFVSYLGAGRWFYLALDIGAIVASALTARTLSLRAKAGPRFVALIACAVLIAYPGSKMLVYVLLKTVPLYEVFGLPAISISLLAVAVLAVLRTKVFVHDYARGL
jgi:hypothetical protein